VMNNWAVVQTYYVGYHAIQALVTARGQPARQPPEDSGAIRDELGRPIANICPVTWR